MIHYGKAGKGEGSFRRLFYACILAGDREAMDFSGAGGFSEVLGAASGG
jgi:hypothetical protein